MDDVRRISFSIKPADVASLTEIEKLKKYSNTRGISFSYLIIQAIKKYNEQLRKKT